MSALMESEMPIAAAPTAAFPNVKILRDVSELKGDFPAPSELDVIEQGEALEIARSFLPIFEQLLTDPARAAHLVGQHYHPEGFLRDFIALTWNYRTFQGISQLQEALPAIIERAKPVPGSLELQEENVMAVTLVNDFNFALAPVTFRTAQPAATCLARFKLVRLKSGVIKIFVLSTTISSLDQVPWQAMPPTPTSPPRSVDRLPAKTDILVVGASSTGLALAAFLRALRADFVQVDAMDTMGDSWATRYASAKLHTVRSFSGPPYRGFPSDYPQYVPAGMIAQFYRGYTKEMDLPIYLSRRVTKGRWDADLKAWRVPFNGKFGPEEIIAKHLVYAVGIGGRFPAKPILPGEDSFKGEILHSAAYNNPSSWKGKRVVVVGSATTACDVAHDSSRAGADVTIIQRGSTRVYPQADISKVQALWDQMPVEMADQTANEDPVVLQAHHNRVQLKIYNEINGPALYDGLRKAGFKFDHEGSIQNVQVYCRQGAHYIDIGCCGAIARGEVKIKSDSAITHFTPDGLGFADGTHLPADVIVFCTGFLKDLRPMLADMLGYDAVKGMEPCWGINEEGEILGMWKPTPHPNVWIQGGELSLSRWYGKFLALQIIATLEGIKPEPY